MKKPNQLCYKNIYIYIIYNIKYIYKYLYNSMGDNSDKHNVLL